jgi:hypothetical protein
MERERRFVRGRIGAERDPLSERGDDLYSTPYGATRALMKAERLPRHIWEPAAGHGAIVKVLREAGHAVLASDLVDYGEPTHFHGRDFLMEYTAPIGCECIVTNPPYKLADQFARHAIELCPKVCMLLRLLFLEGTSRADILDRGLARVHLFSNRLPRMHRESWDGPQASSTVAFAWFVWERHHTGPTELHRITWERDE